VERRLKLYYKPCECIGKQIVLKCYYGHFVTLCVHLFQLPPREKYNCVSLHRYNVYTRRVGEAALQLVESGELSTRAMLSDVDPYANLTVGVSLINSAGLESVIKQTVVVGSKLEITIHCCLLFCYRIRAECILNNFPV